ncbi:MAG: sucrase ferredoxin [Actinomycetota bacterium]|nr:sucrase ferredoxin [Actinomycetota bacterium]
MGQDPVRPDPVTRGTGAGVGREGRPSVSHATSDPTACSVLTEEAGVTAYGTAARARFWVALEQNGPWGRSPATDSHLDPHLGGDLDRACSEAGGRLILIRRPGSHADPHLPGPDRDSPRRCYLAWTGGPGGDRTLPEPWLRTVLLDSPEQLRQVDLEPLARGDVAGLAPTLVGIDECGPVLLVCTNGRRDVCCAVRGRPVAAAGHAAYPGRVWECSHTGGHRFAPTGVLLPWGRTLARLDQPAPRTLLDAADRGLLPTELLGPAHDRGWSALNPEEQAAESAVRARVGETGLASLFTSPALAQADPREGTSTVEVRHRDGRGWLVDVERRPGDSRAESCGKAHVPTFSWVATVRA